MEAVAISVVIPCLNEEQFIQDCVISVDDAFKFAGVAGEIIVVDGKSEDQTVKILESLRHISSLCVLTNPKRITPTALNMGIKRSKAPVVVILGAHSKVDQGFIKYNLEVLDTSPDVTCSGGVILNDYENNKSGSIGKVLTSRLGVGDARFRTGGKAGEVDTVAFGAYRREVFDQVGLFDERLPRNQDDEFNYRLTKAGLKLYFDPRIRSIYHSRNSLLKVTRQYFQYGHWKVFVNRLHGVVTTKRQLVPMLFVLYLVLGLPALYLMSREASPLLRPLVVVGLAPLFLYLLGVIANAVRMAKGLFEFVLIVCTFFGVHIGYGIGYITGILRFIVLRMNPSFYEPNLTR